MNYSKKEIEKLLDGIYAGDISEYNIPESLYFSIADYLKSGLYKGFGGDLTDFKGKDLELLQELRENTYMFSAAKSFQEVKQIGSLMFNEDGDLRSSREFSALGAAEFDKWNKDWGLTERNTAIAQAKMAGKWNEIQENKDLLPYLTYSTIGDACDICAPLDGLTAKVDDPIWNSVMPVNHFNCECVVLQGEDTGTLTPEREKEAIYDTVTGEMSDTFKMNPGKDGYIFSPDHPYFEVAPKDQAFAKTNFGLPIPSPEEELNPLEVDHEFKPEIFEKWGVKLNDEVYDLLNGKIDVHESKRGAYAIASKSEIHIDLGPRWKESPYYQKQVLYHEMGHIIHDRKGLIKFTQSVSPEYKSHFDKLKKLVKDPLLIEEKLKDINRIAYIGRDKDELSELLTKYNLTTREDLQNAMSSTYDSLMALTNSRYGGGHTKKYMSITGAKEAEMFAHSVENTFNGNLMFKDVMPDVYKESIEFIKSIQP